MEVNYKLLLDYVDDQLEGLEARQVMARVREEEFWQIALRRIRLVLDQPELQSLPGDISSWPDENLIAGFLDGTLQDQEKVRIEQLIEKDDHLLAHLATCHRVLTGLTELKIGQDVYQKMYSMGGELTESGWRSPVARQASGRRKELLLKTMEAVSLGKYFYAACGVLVFVACIGLIVARYHKPEPEVQLVAYQEQKSQPAPEPTSLESVPVVVPEKSKTPDPVVVEQKMEKKEEPVTKLVKPAIQEEKKPSKPQRPLPLPADLTSKVEVGILKPFENIPGYLFLKEQSAWKFVSQGNALISNIDHTCLPMQQAVMEISPDMLLGLQGWVHGSTGVMRPMPVRLAIHPAGKVDLDITFSSGRLRLEAARKSARVVIRRPLITPATPLELEMQPGTVLVMETIGDKNPWCRLVVDQGRCKWMMGEDELELLARSGQMWDKAGKRSRVSEKEADKVLSREIKWNQQAMDTPGALQAAISEMFLALKPGVDPAKGILEWVKSPRSNDARRWLGCFSLAALEQATDLLDILFENEGGLPFTRFASLSALRTWNLCKQGPENSLEKDVGLSQLLEQKGVAKSQLKPWMEMVFLWGDPPTHEDYEFLLQQLLGEDRQLRESAHATLAWWSEAGTNPEFLRNANREGRTMEVSRWRELMEQGKLPVR